jgi:hypothetical protein
MQISQLQPPTNGGTLYTGKAVSKRGRQYIFYATFRGEACGVFRDDPPYGRWLPIKAPPALREAVRQSVSVVRAAATLGKAVQS